MRFKAGTVVIGAMGATKAMESINEELNIHSAARARFLRLFGMALLTAGWGFEGIVVEVTLRRCPTLIPIVTTGSLV